MKAFGKLALASLLAAGAGPAMAAKDVPVAGPRFSPAALKVAKPAQDAVLANNPIAAETPVAALEAAATTEDDRYVAALLRLALEQQKYNAALIASPGRAVSDAALVRPLDALIASPSTPAGDRARYLVRRGEMAHAGRQYPVAIELFNRARAAGYEDDNLNLEIVKAKIDSGDVAGGTAELERTVAALSTRGQKAPVDYYRYAIGRANKSRLTAQTVGWMNRYAAAYPGGPTWYEILTGYGFQGADSAAQLDAGQKLDLFRLLRASGGLSDQYGYIQYAQTARGAGLTAEAQAILKEGVAAGRIPASSPEAKALLPAPTKAQPTAAALEAKVNTAANGQAATQAGDAYLGSGNWTKAAALYRTALGKGGVDADAVNTRLGIALALSGDKGGALAAFGAVRGAPRADIASFWKTWLNTTPPT